MTQQLLSEQQRPIRQSNKKKKNPHDTILEACGKQLSYGHYSATIHILSSNGIQQGESLGPLLFSLAVHPIAEKIATQCNLDLNAWYLDEGTIADDTMEVAKALKIIQTNGPLRGLHLNVAKTEIFWPSFDPRRDVKGTFPTEIGKPSIGVKILDGLSASICNIAVIWFSAKLTKLCSLWASCSGVSRLYFTLRTNNPLAIQNAATQYDKHLMQYLRNIIVGDDAGFGLLQQRLATLPIKDGGLGVHTMEDTGNYRFLASCAQTQHLQRTILKQSSVLDSSPSF
ncbi:uncharacterized protein LOC113280347 [Papaver somniferum]|uniref:uncharacterized protein LOC113280347 n=1 Tax=Papaver somniferum TaxID=3469 RepID=UPI000E703612|nr:uncharacterized protein LOC113280347 [Papaver somniferum]